MKHQNKFKLDFFMNKSDFVMIKIFPVLIMLTVISIIILTGCNKLPDTDKPVSESAFVLNTLISITLYDTNDSSIIEQCFKLCENYELVFSRTNTDSELYRLNESGSGEVSDDLLHVLKTALHYCELSEGCFDITMGKLSDMYGFSSENPTVPSSAEIQNELNHVDYKNIVINGNHVEIINPDTVIDLGAIAKGYIADKVKEFLISKGVHSAIINLGGNILCVGNKPDGDSFTIGIQYPFGDVSDPIAEINISDLSVVTSGVYERYFYQDNVLYHHILNPKTGLPCNNGLLSVTIVGKNSEICDAMSTTAFVMGLDSMEMINKMNDIYAVFVTDDYKLVFSEGFREKFM